MYHIGERVFHTSYGICDIIDIQEKKFSEETKNYYILKPIEDHGNSIIYIPVGKASKLTRTIYSPKQIDLIIENSKNETVEWTDNTNYRKAVFTEILK